MVYFTLHMGESIHEAAAWGQCTTLTDFKIDKSL